jgi:hypothetical protein
MKQQIQFLRQASMATALDGEMLRAFHEQGTAISGRISRLEAEIAALPTPKRTSPDILLALHRRLVQLDLGWEIEQAVAAENWAPLREFCQAVVQSAKVVERQPQKKARWLRMEVTWTPEVRELLDQGLRTLGEGEALGAAAPVELRRETA